MFAPERLDMFDWKPLNKRQLKIWRKWYMGKQPKILNDEHFARAITAWLFGPAYYFHDESLQKNIVLRIVLIVVLVLTNPIVTIAVFSPFKNYLRIKKEMKSGKILCCYVDNLIEVTDFLSEKGYDLFIENQTKKAAQFFCIDYRNVEYNKDDFLIFAD